MKPVKTGLIVGKFCPLHKGHQYLIETAQNSCERLIVISYAKPGYLGCEPQKRKEWLETLYPDTIRLVVDDDWFLDRKAVDKFTSVPHDTAPDETHRLFTAWLSHDVLGETVDAIFTSESYGDGFAEVVSEYQSSAAKHICVDMARNTVPISGTKIRENPIHYKEFLADEVFCSFIKRAVFLGGESTGKSSLAEALALTLKTKFAPEYGREIWEAKDGKLVFNDMLHIAKTQILREKSLACEATNWLFCDTSPLTTLFYSEAMFGKVCPVLAALASRFYDVTFLCSPDFEFVQDGTRRDVEFQTRQHLWYQNALAERNIDYVVLERSIERRIATVLKAIENT